MKYLKTYENLGFEINDAVGREIYILMTDDEKYFFDYNSSHDGSLKNYRLKPISKITVSFLENHGYDKPLDKDWLTRKSQSNDFKLFYPNGDEYKGDLKNIKWFLGGYKIG